MKRLFARLRGKTVDYSTRENNVILQNMPVAWIDFSEAQTTEDLRAQAKKLFFDKTETESGEESWFRQTIAELYGVDPEAIKAMCVEPQRIMQAAAENGKPLLRDYQAQVIDEVTAFTGQPLTVKIAGNEVELRQEHGLAYLTGMLPVLPGADRGYAPIHKEPQKMQDAINRFRKHDEDLRWTDLYIRLADHYVLSFEGGKEKGDISAYNRGVWRPNQERVLF
tara:strand:+ start:7635 stop:8303 length:669 start_codon:yes stop_codon:yes gene_type:complete